MITSWNVGWNSSKINTLFYHQYQEIEQEYNTFSQNTPYQIHANANIISKPINTKKISEELYKFSQSVSFPMTELQEALEEIDGQQTQIEIPPKS
jgi:hypothetical protein